MIVHWSDFTKQVMILKLVLSVQQRRYQYLRLINVLGQNPIVHHIFFDIFFFSHFKSYQATQHCTVSSIFTLPSLSRLILMTGTRYISNTQSNSISEVQYKNFLTFTNQTRVLHVVGARGPAKIHVLCHYQLKHYYLGEQAGWIRN